jgi:phosphomannomutase
MVYRVPIRHESAGKQQAVTTEHIDSGLDGSFVKCGRGVVRWEVGDRNVYYAMLERPVSFDGEESGHRIWREFSTRVIFSLL